LSPPSSRAATERAATAGSGAPRAGATR
jgi:hypothetical protein